jgi:hypothetical protein
MGMSNERELVNTFYFHSFHPRHLIGRMTCVVRFGLESLKTVRMLGFVSRRSMRQSRSSKTTAWDAHILLMEHLDRIIESRGAANTGEGTSLDSIMKVDSSLMETFTRSEIK